MGRARQISVFSALTLLTLAGCASSDAQTEKAFERWKAREPSQYVVQTCTMGTEPPGCVRAVVEDGEVVSIAERIYAEDFGWEDFTDEHGGAESPLDYMFSRVEAGDDEECTLESVQYDAKLGYIESYTLLCGGSVTGGRWVACFEAGTTDAERCDEVP